MSYTQDRIQRQCSICEKPILEGQEMLDLFRKQSSVSGTKERVCWCHESCAKGAIELFLTKRWQRRGV